MDLISLALAALVAVLFFVGYMVLDAYFSRKKQSETLADRIANDEHFGMDDGDEALMSLEKEPSPLAQSVLALLRLFGSSTATSLEKLTFRFRNAGLNPIDGPIYYLFMQRVMSFVFVAISIPFLLSEKTGNDYYLDLFVGIIIAGLGLFGPYLYLTNAITKRKQVLQRSFPDALDLMLVCVESGLSLDASLNRVCRELGKPHPIITEELNRTRLELALLNDRTKALLALGDRTDLVPFRSLAAALIQTEKFGTSLTDTLRVLADDYRQTRLLMAEAKAGRLPALITVPLITMLLPSFMLIVLGPAIVGMVNSKVFEPK